MKELKDYRDEIFRRSEEKKRQIKKRRSIALGVGIPLCLCCVLTVAVIPLIPMGMKGAAAPDMEAVYDNGMILEDAEMTVQDFQFTARVVECGDHWVLVEPLEGEQERNSCDRISFSTQDLEDIGIQVGSKVEITYNGEIMETYPAQIRPISWHLV